MSINLHPNNNQFPGFNIYHFYKYTRSLCLSLVVLVPPGPLYLPISTQRNITCSAEGTGRQLFSLSILFSDINPVSSFVVEGKEVIQGIEITSVNQLQTRALISVNTDNTSIIGLICRSVTTSTIIEESALNLTIYGE